MTNPTLKVAAPDRMDFSYNEEGIVYEEVYIADDGDIAQKATDTTQEIAKAFVNNLEDEEGDNIDVDVTTEADEHYATVTVTITPGRPEGAENIGLAAIAGELMGTLAISDPMMWDVVVKSTEGSAKDMLANLKGIGSGSKE